MDTYIPLNTINSDFDRVTLREKLDKAKTENTRLSKYNIDLKLEIIDLRQELNNIKKTTK
ncbi:MAG: hypothetical protein Unbinned8210contig1002_34 [Prokaryotic dsDNA virus sp.]|nr:MAG: hypothetical protein Unbinned8210contig1002_34 [Prokaryotic dsDNA virus sp.]|tara:strand:- start:4053 stop:4232 length:180 start_codon:yes stop_codon:yes gene_type:complete